MGIFKLLLLVCGGLVLQHVVRFAYKAGFHKVTYNHKPGSCRLLNIADGSEDIETLPNGISFISSGLRFGANRDIPALHNVKGAIYMFDFNKPNQAAIELPIEGKIDLKNFSPHGISLWTNKKTGKHLLFVINHELSTNVDRIERFEIDLNQKKLIHLESIFDDELRLVNDLVATGERQFYITNYAYSRSHLGQELEKFLLLSWGSIAFYDGKKATIVVPGLLIPNGINMSPDGKYVYLSELGHARINVYTRGQDNLLTPHDHINIYTLADNLDVTENGDIWTGAHPIMHQAMQYLKDPSLLAPSQVLRIQMKDGRATSISEVYSNDGHEHKASTVASYYKGAMLVGSVHSEPLYCEVKYLD